MEIKVKFLLNSACHVLYLISRMRKPATDVIYYSICVSFISDLKNKLSSLEVECGALRKENLKLRGGWLVRFRPYLTSLVHPEIPYLCLKISMNMPMFRVLNIRHEMVD